MNSRYRLDKIKLLPCCYVLLVVYYIHYIHGKIITYTRMIPLFFLHFQEELGEKKIIRN